MLWHANQEVKLLPSQARYRVKQDQSMTCSGDEEDPVDKIAQKEQSTSKLPVVKPAVTLQMSTTFTSSVLALSFHIAADAVKEQ